MGNRAADTVGLGAEPGVADGRATPAPVAVPSPPEHRKGLLRPLKAAVSRRASLAQGDARHERIDAVATTKKSPALEGTGLFWEEVVRREGQYRRITVGVQLKKLWPRY